MAENYTPMMQQYLAVKKEYEDAILFYRIGDFYEMFFDDAKIASKELDLVLTGKNAGVEERVPMCGIPHHAAAAYIPRLVSRGFKVAICEQTQDPKEAVGLVTRDVIRVITPGTVMQEISDEKTSVYLAAITDYGYGYSLAIVEMSTGENYVQNIEHKDVLLMQTLLRSNVREVVVSSDFKEKTLKSFRELQIVISYCDETCIKEEYLPLTEGILKDYDMQAYGRMLNYLENTQKHMLGHLQVTRIEREDEVLYMDFATRQNLELVQSLHENGKAITLWSFLDMCKSAMGSRQLRKWIEKPLVSREKIEARFNKTEWLIQKLHAKDNKLRDSF